MTWEQAIRKVGHTHGLRRREVFRAARAAGLTYRTIAAVAGLSLSNVHRIVAQRQPTQDELLQRAAEVAG